MTPAGGPGGTALLCGCCCCCRRHGPPGASWRPRSAPLSGLPAAARSRLDLQLTGPCRPGLSAGLDAGPPGWSPPLLPRSGHRGGGAPSEGRAEEVGGRRWPWRCCWLRACQQCRRRLAACRRCSGHRGRAPVGGPSRCAVGSAGSADALLGRVARWLKRSFCIWSCTLPGKRCLQAVSRYGKSFPGGREQGQPGAQQPTLAAVHFLRRCCLLARAKCCLHVLLAPLA